MTSFMPVVQAAQATWERVDISILNASIVALLGYAMIFFGLILLMCVVLLIGLAFAKKVKTKAAAQVQTAEEKPAEAAAPTAPGSAGQLKLWGVDPKTAAMIMAIVANKMGKPINELRFLSIKEVE